MLIALIRDYYVAEILYNFLSILMYSNEKFIKLESCKSHRNLHFLYKNHLHPISYGRMSH